MKQSNFILIINFLIIWIFDLNNSFPLPRAKKKTAAVNKYIWSWFHIPKEKIRETIPIWFKMDETAIDYLRHISFAITPKNDELSDSHLQIQCKIKFMI